MENNWQIGNTCQLLCFIIDTYLHAYLHHVYIHVHASIPYRIYLHMHSYTCIMICIHCMLLCIAYRALHLHLSKVSWSVKISWAREKQVNFSICCLGVFLSTNIISQHSGRNILDLRSVSFGTDAAITEMTYLCLSFLLL